MSDLTADRFVSELKAFQSDHERAKIRRYFRADGPDNDVIGVRMRQLFDTAKQYTGMSLAQVEKLLDSPYYEARMGAVSILDFKARKRSLTDDDRRALYELYLRRHERINNWDLVDRSAPRVIGAYLADRPRDVLYRLAGSENIWQRRTAVVATWYLIFRDDLDDAFALAAALLQDHEELINKAVGTTLRYAGDRDRARLLAFLDERAGHMPRVTLRYAIEKLDPPTRKHYLSLGR